MEPMQKIEQNLRAAIFEVFEKMFYVFLEPGADSRWPPEGAVSIFFRGALQGELVMVFEKGLAEVMARNMLNLEEEEITDPLVEDCLKEAINMIGGNFLRIFDGEKVFDLSLPMVGTRDGGLGRIPLPAGETVRLDFTGQGGKLGLLLAVTNEETDTPLTDG